jgi:hypothetical protein
LYSSRKAVSSSGVMPVCQNRPATFENDTLDRVFFFNNDTKAWTFYINEEAFSDANDLTNVASGLPIWIRVTEDTTVELNNEETEFTCVNPGTDEEDCWNLIVFP